MGCEWNPSAYHEGDAKKDQVISETFSDNKVH